MQPEFRRETSVVGHADRSRVLGRGFNFHVEAGRRGVPLKFPRTCGLSGRSAPAARLRKGYRRPRAIQAWKRRCAKDSSSPDRVRREHEEPKPQARQW